MSEETEELLNNLESMEDAPLIWINQKVLNLYKENQQLKEMFEDSKTYSKQFLYKHNKNLLEANEKLQQQRDKYKEVVEEVREYIIDCSSREITLDIAEIYEKRGIEWIN